MTKPYFRDEIFLLFGEWATTKFDINKGAYLTLNDPHLSIHRGCGGMTTLTYAEFVMDMRDGRIIKCRHPELLILNTIEAWTNPHNYPTLINPKFPWSSV